MESDSDYEEPSEDPFEGQFSDSDDSDAKRKIFKERLLRGFFCLSLE